MLSGFDITALYYNIEAVVHPKGVAMSMIKLALLVIVGFLPAVFLTSLLFTFESPEHRADFYNGLRNCFEPLRRRLTAFVAVLVFAGIFLALAVVAIKSPVYEMQLSGYSLPWLYMAGFVLGVIETIRAEFEVMRVKV